MGPSIPPAIGRRTRFSAAHGFAPAAEEIGLSVPEPDGDKVDTIVELNPDEPVKSMARAKKSPWT